MDNKSIENEAKRIVKELIKIENNNKSLDETIDKIMKNNVKFDKMYILIYVTKILSEEGYEIKSCSPLIIEKIQF